MQKLADIRREYGALALEDAMLSPNPLVQFEKWLADIIQLNVPDPTSMVLSTVDENNYPDARVLLLKGIETERFIFYTHYTSPKGKQLQHIPFAALTFYWPLLARQVRVRGSVEAIPAAASDAYFTSRPIESQINALISAQSESIPDRATLEIAFTDALKKASPPIPRPKHWGGYALTPRTIEFWQGRDNRLHDRFIYQQHTDHHWTHQRLAP